MIIKMGDKFSHMISMIALFISFIFLMWKWKSKRIAHTFLINTVIYYVYSNNVNILRQFWKKKFSLNNVKLSNTFSDLLLNIKAWYLQAWLLKWFVIDQFFFLSFSIKWITSWVKSNCSRRTSVFFFLSCAIASWCLV